MNRLANAASTALFFLTCANAQAGRIYGGLQVQNQAVPSGTALQINCGGTTYSGTVKQHGRYSIDVSKQGPCTLNLPAYAGASIRLISFREATRYNFQITRANGSYRLRRK